MGRKANGEGTITKLPSGSYRLRTVDEIDGVTVRKSFTASSPTACRKAHKEWLASEHKVTIEKVKTVTQWAEHWVELYKKPEPGKSAGAYKDYKMYISRHINPEIGKLKLNDVRPAHIKKLFRDSKTKPNRKYPEGKPLSRSSAEKLLWALEGIFKTAIENRLCKQNPVVGIELPPKSPKAPSVFKRNHMSAIVKYLSEHEYGPFIALYLYSGLRPGEGFGLMWVDRDKENHTFHIRRSLTLVEEEEKPGVFKHEITPGTKSEDESIVTYNTALDPLLDKIPKTGVYVMSRPVKFKDDLGETHVIYEHHTHASYDELYYKFFDDLNCKITERAEEESKKIGEKIDPDLIPRLTPHKMRHTFATYLRRSGVDLDDIRELLRHKSISTTQIYDTVDIEDKKASVSKLKY